MNPVPPEPFSCNFSSGGHDGAHTITTSGITMDTTARQGFGHLGQASIGSINPSPGVPGSFPHQHLQYASQHGIPPNPQEGEGTLGSYGSTTEASTLSSDNWLTEGIGDEYAPLFPEPDIRIATNTGSYGAEGSAQPHNPDRTNGPSLRNWPTVS